ncbi:MAG TPA: ATP-binding protein, partial [Bacteroidia bacterium]|nr:ATP-binding protein [Bacteroidia bacterium]
EQRRNLFLIIKESLHNSIKHASAKEIVLVYEKTENGHRLSIRDNGIGFSEQDIQTKKGNGLSNLQKRAIKINSRVNIQSEPGKGTVVIIDFI